MAEGRAATTDGLPIVTEPSTHTRRRDLSVVPAQQRGMMENPVGRPPVTKATRR